MTPLTDHQRAIIGAVLAQPGIRRPDLAARLGLSAQTVMRAVHPLIDGGALKESQVITGGRGKPASSLQFVPHSLMTLGISLASDRIRVELCDLAGAPIAAQSTVRDFEGATDQLAVLDALIDACLEQVPKTAQLVAAGVSVQGYFLARGTRFAAKADPAGWVQIDLHAHLQSRLSVPVRLMNDGKTVASSLMFGAPYQHFICLHLGSGIGGGIVCNGQLLTGANGNAGELGNFFPKGADRPVESLYLSAVDRKTWDAWPGIAGLSQAAQQRMQGLLAQSGAQISTALAQVLAALDFEAAYLCSRMPADVLAALVREINIAPLGTDVVGQNAKLRNPPPLVHPFHVPHYARLACQMALDAFLTPTTSAAPAKVPHGNPVA